MLKVSGQISIPENEIEINAVHSQGSGGQNVNKVATAIHLRFDIPASSLPDQYKRRLMKYRDRRINKQGIVVIKAQNYRSQEKNRDEALQRLRELINKAIKTNRKRIPTHPTRASNEKRLSVKSKRAQLKRLRSRDNIDV